MGKNKRSLKRSQEEPPEEDIPTIEATAADAGEQDEEEKTLVVAGDGEQEDSKRKRKRKRKRAASTNEAAVGGDEEGEQDDEGDEEGGHRSSAAAPASEGPFTAYVEGISYEATADDVKSFFQDKGCGKVLEVRMPCYQDSGRPRGYAHLDFKKHAGLEKALGLNGQHLMGRYLKVERANDASQPRPDPSKPKPPGCKTVFVKNLPYEATEDDVKEAFTFCGKIANVRLALWNHTKAKKGFGYVDFVKEASAEIAVKKQGTIRVGGRLVYIDYETGQPKGSFRTSDGKSWKKARVGGKRE